MSDYQRKLDAAMKELRDAGVWKSNANPPYLRLMLKLGLTPRPPHYAAFFQIVVTQGVWFGAAWGGLMWFWQWQSQGLPFGLALFAALAAGSLFGVAMAFIYAKGRKKHSLSDWQSL